MPSQLQYDVRLRYVAAASALALVLYATRDSDVVSALRGPRPANLIENPSFELTWARDADAMPMASGWQLFMVEYPHVLADATPFARSGQNAFAMYHDWSDHWLGMGQSVFFTHSVPLRLELACYVAGFEMSAPLALAVDIEFADGSLLMDRAVRSPTGTFGWTQLRITVPASKPIRSAERAPRRRRAGSPPALPAAPCSSTPRTPTTRGPTPCSTTFRCTPFRSQIPQRCVHAARAARRHAHASRDSQLDPDLGACPRGHSCWGDAAMEERFDWLLAENASIRDNADQITYVTQARALHGALHASWAQLRVARPRSSRPTARTCCRWWHAPGTDPSRWRSTCGACAARDLRLAAAL